MTLGMDLLQPPPVALWGRRKVSTRHTVSATIWQLNPRFDKSFKDLQDSLFWMVEMTDDLCQQLQGSFLFESSSTFLMFC